MRVCWLDWLLLWFGLLLAVGCWLCWFIWLVLSILVCCGWFDCIDCDWSDLVWFLVFYVCSLF